MRITSPPSHKVGGLFSEAVCEKGLLVFEAYFPVSFLHFLLTAISSLLTAALILKQLKMTKLCLSHPCVSSTFVSLSIASPHMWLPAPSLF